MKSFLSRPALRRADILCVSDKCGPGGGCGVTVYPFLLTLSQDGIRQVFGRLQRLIKSAKFLDFLCHFIELFHL